MTSFEETQETLALLKILALGNADMAAGKLKPAAQVFEELYAESVCKQRSLNKFMKTT